MALGLARAGANVLITATHSRSEIDAVANEAAETGQAGAIRATGPMPPGKRTACVC
jgi:NAD(P)-dependent dehydrogenase (short-subunit alcohol dehydrogenase family)